MRDHICTDGYCPGCADLRGALSQVNEENAMGWARAAELKAERDTIQAELASLESCYTVAQGERAQAEAELEAARAELAECERYKRQFVELHALKQARLGAVIALHHARRDLEHTCAECDANTFEQPCPTVRAAATEDRAAARDTGEGQ
jgi:chromosome segregation ATPase